MFKPTPLVAVLATAFASLAHAGGFALDEQGAAGMGNAYAGIAAAVDDASAVLHNPAALTRLKSMQVNGGVNIVGQQAKFKASGSQTWLVDRASGRVGTTSLPTGTPTGEVRNVGGGGDDASQAGAVPAAYFAMPINDRLAFGVGLHVPFGTETKFDANWAGRYTAIDTKMAALTISPAVAWKASEQVSLGMSLNATYLDAEVTKALDFRYEASIAELAMGSAVPVLDGKATLKGDGWGWGATLAALFQLDGGARIGATFRTAATPEAKGDYRVEIPGLYTQIAAGLGQKLESEVQSAKADVKLPWRFSLAADVPLNNTWSLQADLTRTGWSRFDELRAKVNNTPDQVQTQNWRDTTRLGLGASWKQSDALTWRFGLAYDQTPVRSAEWRHPGTPDSDRFWLAAGAGWKPNKDGQLDVAFSYGVMKDGDVNYTDTAYNRADYPFFAAEQKFRVQGSFDLAMWGVGVQYRQLF
ncbi:OmpP1/FadL family transporter [Parachitinimonas caeni]|uniref:Outer membrane protein transport protein n=1 Tax=Parachitinimonas caeni TaxID=3031301 RepID=A0ABT7E362_9NEIS|nr:outer membrane protein transport protein [Parachitinimonas caeni]MDK2125753.1 outer membrane protein transport protein [Parachitinimonas caeni]